jgi:hypothetical protein
MRHTALLRCARQPLQHRRFGVQADVRVRDDAGNLAQHGRADQRQLRRGRGRTQYLEVVDPGVTQSAHPGGQHRGGDVGRTERRLGHRRDPDPSGTEPLDQSAGVVADLREVYLQPGRTDLVPDRPGGWPRLGGVVGRVVGRMVG